MKVKIQTMLGDIVVRLYDETPIHRDNFIKLAKEGYYDGTLFHRVIKDFMIQGGDPDSKGAPAGKMLGVGDPGYTLEAEIKDGLFHKRGALAAARQGDEVNPERRSSGSQFYIVWGQVYNEGQLKQFSKQLKMQKVQASFNELAAEHRAEIMQMRRERNRAGLQELQDKLAAEAESKVGKIGLTDDQMKLYSTVGGTPHLDGQYTVFGEVEEGLDVVGLIQGTATGRADRPVDDIEMRMTVIDWYVGNRTETYKRTDSKWRLDRSSYDFGKPKWHLLEVLKVPSVYRGLRLVYFYDDDREFDVSQELQIEYYDWHWQFNR